MEGKIIYDWDEFEEEFSKLGDAEFYINLDISENGNVLRIYAEDEDTVLIFEPDDLDLRKWKKKLEKRLIEYRWGESPVRIVEQ